MERDGGGRRGERFLQENLATQRKNLLGISKCVPPPNAMHEVAYEQFEGSGLFVCACVNTSVRSPVQDVCQESGG